MFFFVEPLIFEWNEGNQDKNLIKHGVSCEEIEEVFFDSAKKVFADIPHSGKEKRFILLGQTKAGRYLSVVYTERSSKIRVISARDTSKKEIKLLRATS